MPLFDLPDHLQVQSQVRWPAAAEEALPLALVGPDLIAHQQAACRVLVGVAGVHQDVREAGDLSDLDHALVHGAGYIGRWRKANF